MMATLVVVDAPKTTAAASVVVRALYATLFSARLKSEQPGAGQSQCQPARSHRRP
jgi:hypothetical protein